MLYYNGTVYSTNCTNHELRKDIESSNESHNFVFCVFYDIESMPLSDRQEAELEVTEIRILSFSLGVSKMEWTRSENIRGTVHVRCFGNEAREARLTWFRLTRFSE